MYLIDLLLHRTPWNGDRIRLYRLDVKPIDTFIGEFYIKIKGGNVLVLDNTDRRYIRGDLPKWSSRFSCWEYYYSPSGGE
jgi:hypothetical protein